MKITIAPRQIIAGLQAVPNVGSTRPPRADPFQRACVRAADGKREFTATDIDVTFACSVEAKVEEKAGPPPCRYI